MYNLKILILAKACVLAQAHYKSVALGHWRVQYLKKQRINNILNLINCLFTYINSTHHRLASC